MKKLIVSCLLGFIITVSGISQVVFDASPRSSSSDFLNKLKLLEKGSQTGFTREQHAQNIKRLYKLKEDVKDACNLKAKEKLEEVNTFRDYAVFSSESVVYFEIETTDDITLEKEIAYFFYFKSTHEVYQSRLNPQWEYISDSLGKLNSLQDDYRFTLLEQCEELAAEIDQKINDYINQFR